jgi:hypothetical protein
MLSKERNCKKTHISMILAAALAFCLLQVGDAKAADGLELYHLISGAGVKRETKSAFR